MYIINASHAQKANRRPISYLVSIVARVSTVIFKTQNIKHYSQEFFLSVTEYIFIKFGAHKHLYSYISQNIKIL